MSDQQQNTEQLSPQQMNNNQQQEVICQEQHNNNDRQQEVVQPHIKLTADQESRLKQFEYNRGQSGQMYQNIDPKAQANMNRHGRDHGQHQIQRRSQNH